MIRKGPLHRIRQRIGGMLLDFAEARPQAKRGRIHHLQLIREFQRKNAVEPQRDPNALPNSTITLSSIRLVEAYSIENFDRVRRALQRLFPNLPRDAPRSNLLTELDQSIRRLNAGSWWNVGMLVREKGRSFYAVPVRELPDLPVQVESIRVRAQHILPSTAILTFDVRLTDEASDELNRIQARSYLPEITFNSFIRWESGHSELPVEWVRQNHVRGWVDRLRSEIEQVLKVYLQPGLFGAAAKNRPRLPAVEIYLLSVGGDAMSQGWEKRAGWWLESYGIDLDFDVYRSDHTFFQWPREERNRGVLSGHILTVLRNKYLATIEHPEAYGGEKSAILYHAEHGLDALMPVVVILQVLQQTRKVIEELRERVFRRIDAGAPLFRLKYPSMPTRLHAQLLGQSMLLNRLKAEFSQQKKSISRRMQGWAQLTFVPKTGTDEDLRSTALQWIRYETETMQAHLSLARDAFGEYFTAGNTRAIFLLTVAVVILTVVQVLTNNRVSMWLTAALRAVKNAW